jgi:DNA invertase Pin-like site-specific DNA recombinase
MENLTVREARALLERWTAEQAATTNRRDEAIRAGAGLSKSEVHRITGIARTTIGRILTAQTAPSGAANVQPGGQNDR